MLFEHLLSLFASYFLEIILIEGIQTLYYLNLKL